MKKVKKIMTRNKALFLILILVIISIPVILYSCSKEKKDKFVGTCYRNGIKAAVITKKDGKYEYQIYYTYDLKNTKKGEKGALYKDCYVKEGYLIFDKTERIFDTYEYKNDNEIVMVELYRPDIEGGKPLSKATKKVFWTLKRSPKDD
jgi:hypothetical protein